MKERKRILAVLLTLMMVFALAGCGGGDQAGESGEETPAAEQKQ